MSDRGGHEVMDMNRAGPVIAGAGFVWIAVSLILWLFRKGRFGHLLSRSSRRVTTKPD